MTRKNSARLEAHELGIAIPDGFLPFQTTAELSAYSGMIGQERAMCAIETGLSIGTRGFNIFAAGEPGSGKTSTLERLLRERAANDPVPPDICYIYNFAMPDRPRPLFLPPGRGRELSKDMDWLVLELERLVPRVLSDGAFGHIRSGIIADTRRRMDDLTRKASEEAEARGLRIEDDGEMIRVRPVVGGQPIDQEAFEKLSPRKRRLIEKSMIDFQEHLDTFSYGRRQLEREHNRRISQAEVRALTPIVDEVIKELGSRFERLPEVAEYLGQVREHVLRNHRAFLRPEAGEPGNRAEPMLPESDEEGAAPPPPSGDPRLVYQVNVIVDRTGQKGAPVVVERVPSTQNLTGCFEYRETMGGLVTDHSLIRAGALHQAHGGFLLLQAADLLTSEGAWDALKRALRHKDVRVDEGAASSEGRPRLAGTMKPGAVPLQTKVILVGNVDLYYLLSSQDDDFQRLFKIKADFESDMPRTRENVLQLARLVGQVCREEGFLPLHRGGVARLIEYAARQAEHQERLSTRRAEILDLVAEADLHARRGHARSIRGEHLEAALAALRHRHLRVADAVRREIREGTILIRTRGTAVGQINGIAIYDLAGVSFGVPVRITARTYAGRRGVVNIDREVHLSGSIHDKGALILVGYLGGRYAQEHTLGFSASITFEQSYDEIDGDSASSAELYTLLSSLSGVPIRQGISVTGSVNQLGEIQPIGGVNEKIEGIFDVCASRGLTGEEGVMIPRANVKNLMLRGDVVQAVREKRFHVHAVATIDEGIEVLTGVPAGHQGRDGRFAKDSINDLVDRRLRQLESVVREGGVVTALDRGL